MAASMMCMNLCDWIIGAHSSIGVQHYYHNIVSLHHIVWLLLDGIFLKMEVVMIYPTKNPTRLSHNQWSLA